MWSSKLPFICFVLFEHWHSCSMIFSSWLFNKSWQGLYSTCFTQFETSRDNCIGLVRFCSIKWVRLVRKSNSQQNRCSTLFDCRTQSNDWSSIVFDWFFVRFCSIGQVGRRSTSVFANWTVLAPEETPLSMCRSSRAINFRFNSKTQWQMFLLLYGRHVCVPQKDTNLASRYKTL